MNLGKLLEEPEVEVLNVESFQFPSLDQSRGGTTTLFILHGAAEKAGEKPFSPNFSENCKDFFSR